MPFPNIALKSKFDICNNFCLPGISYYPKAEVIMFVLCLLMYLITLLGNIILISITILDSSLYTPMYFFLSYLSCLDVWYTSSAFPPMLINFVSGKNTTLILRVCLSDVLLSCHAYPIIMNKRICVQIAAGSWVTGCFTALVEPVSVLQLSLCGSSVINHFACEILAVLKLVCVDTSVVQLITLVITVLLVPMLMLLICISYAFILSNILRISSVDGQRKAFSTCAAHLTVVVLFHGTALSMYLKPSSVDSQEIDKFMTLVYGALTPMLNPIIYSLRNKEVKAALKNLLFRNSLVMF
uniref:Olfactory receptor family 13 subfamily F member 1 n=1 Tax=Monodon monoceros TaxID=40151 RepID=A0A8C6C0P9_MONMO